MAEFIHDIQLSLRSEESQHKAKSLAMEKMREILDRVAPDWYEEANKLTPEENEKVNGWIKELTAEIEAENRERDLELQNIRKALKDNIDS